MSVLELMYSHPWWTTLWLLISGWTIGVGGANWLLAWRKRVP